MNQTQAKNLFQLQTELIDTKVEMAVNKAVDRVVDQINELKNELKSEMHELRGGMSKRFSSLEHRMIAVETKLGMVSETQREIRAKFIDYSFKAGWLILGVMLSFVIFQFHVVIK